MDGTIVVNSVCWITLTLFPLDERRLAHLIRVDRGEMMLISLIVAAGVCGVTFAIYDLDSAVLDLGNIIKPIDDPIDFKIHI